MLRRTILIAPIMLAGCVTSHAAPPGEFVSAQELLLHSDQFTDRDVAVRGWTGNCEATPGMCPIYSSRKAAEAGGARLEWPLPARFAPSPSPRSLVPIVVKGRWVVTCGPPNICMEYNGHFQVTSIEK